MMMTTCSMGHRVLVSGGFGFASAPVVVGVDALPPVALGDPVPMQAALRARMARGVVRARYLPIGECIRPIDSSLFHTIARHHQGSAPIGMI
jgi:hypothetical protein